MTIIVGLMAIETAILHNAGCGGEVRIEVLG